MPRRIIEVSSPKPVFQEPHTIEQALQQRLRFQSEIDAMQADLSNRNRLDAAGRRLTGESYHQWRHQIIETLRHKQQQLRVLKHWLDERHNPQKAPEWSLLARAYHLLSQFEGEEVEVLLDEIEHVLPAAFLSDGDKDRGGAATSTETP